MDIAHRFPLRPSRQRVSLDTPPWHVTGKSDQALPNGAMTDRGTAMNLECRNVCCFVAQHFLEQGSEWSRLQQAAETNELALRVGSPQRPSQTRTPLAYDLVGQLWDPSEPRPTADQLSNDSEIVGVIHRVPGYPAFVSSASADQGQISNTTGSNETDV